MGLFCYRTSVINPAPRARRAYICDVGNKLLFNARESVLITTNSTASLIVATVF